MVLETLFAWIWIQHAHDWNKAAVLHDGTQVMELDEGGTRYGRVVVNPDGKTQYTLHDLADETTVTYEGRIPGGMGTVKNRFFKADVDAVAFRRNVYDPVVQEVQVEGHVLQPSGAYGVSEGRPYRVFESRFSRLDDIAAHPTVIEQADHELWQAVARYMSRPPECSWITIDSGMPGHSQPSCFSRFFDFGVGPAGL